ncbi:uncharacterized protein LOC5517617 isoform X2 [Nematostella vectensis]|uniref:uncharacterized protein LOC5517617 isoform X2 n=1 Tax=Nematostella vectensis TaxID=45351 RepID=UPI0020778A34|nr:uncharacterized protein LOC5517617 isoform X2 [Nematostella vectensis]
MAKKAGKLTDLPTACRFAVLDVSDDEDSSDESSSKTNAKPTDTTAATSKNKKKRNRRKKSKSKLVLEQFQKDLKEALQASKAESINKRVESQATSSKPKKKEKPVSMSLDEFVSGSVPSGHEKTNFHTNGNIVHEISALDTFLDDFNEPEEKPEKIKSRKKTKSKSDDKMNSKSEIKAKTTWMAERIGKNKDGTVSIITQLLRHPRSPGQPEQEASLQDSHPNENDNLLDLETEDKIDDTLPGTSSLTTEDIIAEYPDDVLSESEDNFVADCIACETTCNSDTVHTTRNFENRAEMYEYLDNEDWEKLADVVFDSETEINNEHGSKDENEEQEDFIELDDSSIESDGADLDLMTAQEQDPPIYSGSLLTVTMHLAAIMTFAMAGALLLPRFPIC